MSNDNESLSEIYFASRTIYMHAEDALCAALNAVGVREFGDFHGDPYDDSLELTGCDNDLRLTHEQQISIRNFGFIRIWLNHLDGMETYYNLSTPSDGHRKKKL